jgi:hypothetical protein
VERDRAMVIIERHQPAILWRLLGIRRCRHCRRRWPCARYLDARAGLLSHGREDIAATIRDSARRSAS